MNRWKRFPQWMILPVAAAVLAMLCAPTVGNSLAQSTEKQPEIVRASPSACELNSLALDALKAEAAKNNEIIFVISRLGKGEMSRNLNRRRLHNARTYLTKSLEPKRVLIAEGDRVDGEGRVEFYLGSSLRLISLLRRSSDLCVTCCEHDADYYGWGKKR